MKKFIAIVLLAELIIGCLAGDSSFVWRHVLIRRQAHLGAFMQLLDNQTPETRAELDRQNRITKLYKFGFSALVFGAMAGPTLLAARAWNRNRTPQAGFRNDKHVG